jgi:hypothetical protein
MKRKIIVYAFVSKIIEVETEKELLNKMESFKDDCIGMHTINVLIEPCEVFKSEKKHNNARSNK